MNNYKTGDMVIYGTEGLCKVQDITEKKFGENIIKYYVLRQEVKKDFVTYVPINHEKSVSKMRPLLTKGEILKIIDRASSEELSWIENDRERHNAFKDIMLYGSSKDMLKLTRALYRRQQEQVAKGKKLHVSDEKVFKEAGKIINEEIAYVFDMEQDKVLDFIADRASK